MTNYRDDNCNQYFDDKSEEYHSKSLSGIWNKVREREAGSLFSFLGDLSDKRVLDIGCGAGFYSRRALALGAQHVVAVDRSAKMIAALPRDRITSYQCDAQYLDLSGNFDRIICAGLLEFVDFPALVLRSARCHAVPGCRAVFHVPAASVFGKAYRLFYRVHGIPIHLFKIKSFKDIAEHEGWNVIAEIRVLPFSLQFLLRTNS